MTTKTIEKAQIDNDYVFKVVNYLKLTEEKRNIEKALVKVMSIGNMESSCVKQVKRTPLEFMNICKYDDFDGSCLLKGASMCSISFVTCLFSTDKNSKKKWMWFLENMTTYITDEEKRRDRIAFEEEVEIRTKLFSRLLEESKQEEVSSSAESEEIRKEKKSKLEIVEKDDEFEKLIGSNAPKYRYVPPGLKTKTNVEIRKPKTSSDLEENSSKSKSKVETTEENEDFEELISSSAPKYRYIPPQFKTKVKTEVPKYCPPQMRTDYEDLSVKVEHEFNSDNESVVSDSSQELMNTTNLESVGRFAKQGKRRSMEDFDLVALDVCPEQIEVETEFELSCFGVFDGHMGSAAAEFCSKELVSRAQKKNTFFKSWPEGPMDVLKDVFAEVDRDFISFASSQTPVLEDGSCALLALHNKSDNELLVANLGDSRALVIKIEENKASFIALSKDHSPNEPVERERIERVGGWVSKDCDNTFRVNSDLGVSRAIGDMNFKAPFHNRCKWFPPRGLKKEEINFLEEDLVSSTLDWVQHEINEKEKFLVLACDGLFETLDRQQVADIVLECYNKQMTLPLIARSLVNTALKRGSGDNVTCLVVKL